MVNLQVYFDPLIFETEIAIMRLTEIGVLIPPTNTSVEADFQRMLSTHAT